MHCLLQAAVERNPAGKHEHLASHAVAAAVDLRRDRAIIITQIALRTWIRRDTAVLEDTP